MKKQLHRWLRNSREQLGISLSEAAGRTGMDKTLLSKIEHGKRLPTEEQARQLAQLYQLPPEDVLTLRMAEKIVGLVGYGPRALKVLSVAESRIQYLIRAQEGTPADLPTDLQELLREVSALHRQWIDKRPLDPLALHKMREYFKIAYTHDSNRIEGNTLTLQETQLVVNEGLTIAGKSMREHLEAINHAEAVDMLYELIAQNIRLDKRLLLELHSIILKSIHPEHAGCYRKVPVRITGSEHVPPQPWLLDKLMEDYFAWYGEARKEMHPVLLAAEMHERLVSIHPFIDGNGRTARLVMNFILMQYGYPIVILKGDHNSRMAYYKALEAVQKDNEPEHFYRLVAEAAKRSLKEHLQMV
ncbi:MAG TPA: helix-turn-helix domain-containing protein [Phaeodactylibacter sp.]|nr:helix-turn-helix domain-containing protein [Phaeodactylibacter sp.]